MAQPEPPKHTKKIACHVDSTKVLPPRWSLAGKPVTKLSEAAPGPGKYGLPSVEEKFKRMPSTCFGTSVRENDGKKWKGSPGPGAYTPFDPNQTSPLFGFGSAARIPKKKDPGYPDPGGYKTASAMDPNKACSLGGRRVGKRASSMPGPGAYDADYRQVYDEPARLVIGVADRDKGAFYQSYSCAPAPGTYVPLKELGGNVATKSCPNFSFKSKRRPGKCDSTPGPNFSNVTQFV